MEGAQQQPQQPPPTMQQPQQQPQQQQPQQQQPPQQHQPMQQQGMQQHPIQQHGMQQQGYVGFGMDPNWGAGGAILPQQMHGQHGYHSGLQANAMDGTPLIPSMSASMDPLEAVLGPFPCVRLRGLPFEASLEDVVVFFQGLVLLDVVVVASGNSDGMGSGEAFVVFANHMDFQMALQRDHHNMGRRYIEVFQGKRADYYAAIVSQHAQQNWQQPHNQENHNMLGGDADKLAADQGNNDSWGSGTGNGPTPAQALATQRGTGNNAPSGNGSNGGAPHKGQGGMRGGRGGAPQSRGGRDGGRGRGGGIQIGEHTGYLRMRGLPFSATKKEIFDFFKAYKPVENSIILTYRSDGRATGEGYVAFKSPTDSKSAMSLHRSTMGSRYIELFISNKEEHTRAMSRSGGR